MSAAVIRMSAFYPQYTPQRFACNYWNPIFPISPWYPVQPIPIVVNPIPPIFSTPIFPYVPPVVVPPVKASSLILSNDTSVSSFYKSLSPVTETTVGSFSECENGAQNTTEFEDPIEYYLSLPKDLFPSTRMMIMDPNEMIDEFCKLSNFYSHASWLLDLEYGIPKSPITRPIPSYNVKFNSIHCKNTPDAIHPGFESCSQGFKQVLLFYYDCIVSVWYRGYVFLNSDRSVENFQSWLQLPMQVLGLSWS